jgi:hypothetical protein
VQEEGKSKGLHIGENDVSPKASFLLRRNSKCLRERKWSFQMVVGKDILIAEGDEICRENPCWLF